MKGSGGRHDERGRVRQKEIQEKFKRSYEDRRWETERQKRK